MVGRLDELLGFNQSELNQSGDTQGFRLRPPRR